MAFSVSFALLNIHILLAESVNNSIDDSFLTRRADVCDFKNKPHIEILAFNWFHFVWKVVQQLLHDQRCGHCGIELH